MFLVFSLQMLAMVLKNAVFLVLVNIYDGLFKGGMLVVVFESTAELAYPVGESLSLGMVNAMQNAFRFLFNIILSLIAANNKPEDIKSVYIAYMAIIFVLILSSIFFYYKSKFVMHRYIADCCLEEIEDEEGDESGQAYQNDLGLRDRLEYNGKGEDHKRLSQISEESL
jgi:hypothetical protein